MSAGWRGDRGAELSEEGGSREHRLWTVQITMHTRIYPYSCRPSCTLTACCDRTCGCPWPGLGCISACHSMQNAVCHTCMHLACFASLLACLHACRPRTWAACSVAKSRSARSSSHTWLAQAAASSHSPCHMQLWVRDSAWGAGGCSPCHMQLWVRDSARGGGVLTLSHAVVGT